MRTHATRSALLILILILALSACASDPAESEADAPAAEGGAPAIEDDPAYGPEPTAEEVAPAYNACEMLTQAEIEAAAFRDFPTGQGQPGTDTPFTRGEAISCRWEVGNPDAQFHERLILYIITLNGADPNTAYEDQAGRLSRAEERSGIGDRAAYEDRSGFLLVLDGDFLFLLRADLLNADDIGAKIAELARLVISRK